MAMIAETQTENDACWFRQPLTDSRFERFGKGETMIRFTDILTTEKAMAAAKKDPRMLQYAPKEVITEAVAMEAAKNDPYSLRYVPKEAITEAVACALFTETVARSLFTETDRN